MEDVVARNEMFVNLYHVCDFKAFPHGVIVKFFEEARLDELDLAQFPQIHVV